MGFVAKLLKDVPVAAKYRAALVAVERDNARLAAENARLREELAEHVQQW